MSDVKKTGSKTTDASNRWFRNPDWYMILLTVLTAWILYSQYWEMRVDTRPWIQVKALDQIPLPQAGSLISVPVHFVNVGKTPAKRLLAYMFVEVVDIDKSPHLPNPEGADKGAYTFVTSGVVFPNVTVDGAARSLKATSETTSEDHLLTEPEYQRLMLGQAYLAVYAVAFYRDAFNTKHWTTFCGFSYFKAGQSALPNACAAYNNVDDRLLW